MNRQRAMQLPPAGAAPVVVDHLTVTYGSQVALDDVCLELQSGSFVGLLGPNGGGKSTLLRAILGIVPASAGEVRIFRAPVGEARGRIAYVPQAGTVRRSVPLTALDVVQMGRYRRRGWLRPLTRADRQAAVAALRQVDMEGRQDEPLAALSSGQQQRVLIARALAQQADIMLLDEPLSGIDLPTQRLILGLAQRLRAEGKTVVMATHDLGLAVQCCDCLCCINRTVVAHGPTDETLRADVLQRTFGAVTSLSWPGGEQPGGDLAVAATVGRFDGGPA